LPARTSNLRREGKEVNTGGRRHGLILGNEVEKERNNSSRRAKYLAENVSQTRLGERG